MASRRDFLTTSLYVAGALNTRAILAASASSTPPKFKNDPFTLGVASGYPSPDGIVLWTRLAPLPLLPGGGMTEPVVPVQWELATDDAMKTVVRRGTEYAIAEWAHSIHVELEGLEPARSYWYRFTCGDARSVVGRTRTAPVRGAPLARLKVAVASCQQYEHGYFSAYRQMLSDELDVIAHVGDYIYEGSWGDNRVRSHGTSETVTLDDYRARYALYKCDSDLAAAHAACPWLVTWDDHEVSNDYAGAIDEDNDEPELFLARRAAAYRAYYEHMPLPRKMVPFGSQMRLYAQRAFGDLASIYMLDQRQYRSPEACSRPGRGGGNRVALAECPELAATSRTMLGDRQEAWLYAAIKASRARWNLLGQGTLMSFLDEDPGPEQRFWTDAWNGYPAARSRLLKCLSETRAQNPVVLSGDIHAFVVSPLRLHAEDPGSAIVASELVTTSITSNGIDQKTMDGWREANPHILVADAEHRGYTRLDITRDRLVADHIVLDVKVQNSPARTLRTYVVEAGKPGPIRA